MPYMLVLMQEGWLFIDIIHIQPATVGCTVHKQHEIVCILHSACITVTSKVSSNVVAVGQALWFTLL